MNLHQWQATIRESHPDATFQLDPADETSSTWVARSGGVVIDTFYTIHLCSEFGELLPL
jgi:hypothetical protein